MKKYCRIYSFCSAYERKIEQIVIFHITDIFRKQRLLHLELNWSYSYKAKKFLAYRLLSSARIQLYAGECTPSVD